MRCDPAPYFPVVFGSNFMGSRSRFERVRWIATLAFAVSAMLWAVGCGVGGGAPEGRAPAQLVYPQTTIVATVGEAVMSDVPTVKGTVTSYSVSPALPAGLSLESATGVISGTPAAVAAQATYTVTASNSAGSTTAMVQITVTAAVVAPVNLSYASATINGTVGQAIAADVPSVTGSVTAYTVTPALPAGLSLNSATGVISGTPITVAAQAAYTVTASNSAGSTTAMVQIAVTAAVVAPVNLSYASATITGTVGQAIAADVPTVTGSVTAYTVTPALPAGLSLNSATGVISGTPITVAAQAAYTVTASNSAGSTTAMVQIAVTAAVVAPVNLSYASATITGTVGQAIAADVPTVTGSVTAYTVTPALPAGLSLNRVTGAISGTPTAVAAQATYTVTASNSAGSTTEMLSILILAAGTAPSGLTYPQTTILVMVGQTVTPDIPSVTGTVTLYTVVPALPAGLSLSSSTGAISGMPTAAAQAAYTVTAASTFGSTTATLTITVSSTGTVLLDVGHATYIELLRESATRVLSQDVNGHWVLWDYSSGTQLASEDQVFPPEYAGNVYNWPVDMAGPTIAIGLTNGVEMRSSVDGHLLSLIQSPTLDPVSPDGTSGWWKLAVDGSYLCGGSTAGLAVWTPSGQMLFSRPGDYSTAIGFAAAGQVQIANGPAGANVIETVSATTGSSSAGPAFSGQFNTWFLDGTQFLTNHGNLVWTYTEAGALEASVLLPTVETLTGQGNWIWTYESDVPGYLMSIYPIGSATATASYNLSVDTKTVPSGTTIGVLPYGVGSASVIDLSGASPVKVDYNLPTAYNQTYAANTPAQWVVGNAHGVLVDGASLSSTTRYLGLGQPWSIAGAPGVAEVAVASGTILSFDPPVTTIQSSISFSSSNLALSTDGSVLAAAANTTDAQYEQDRTIKIFSVPANTLTYSWPYQFQTQPGPLGPIPFSFTLSGSGTILGQLLGTFPSSAVGWNYTRQVTAATGGPTIWSDTPADPYEPVLLSPDGTLIAVSYSPPSSTSVTSIFKNGTLVISLPGQASGWIDNNHLLVNSYTTYTSGPVTVTQYAGATIYDATGAQLATPALPELISFEPVDSGSVYSPALNAIYSVSTGQALWKATYQLSGPGAVAGGYVVYLSGSRVIVESH